MSRENQHQILQEFTYENCQIVTRIAVTVLRAENFPNKDLNLNLFFQIGDVFFFCMLCKKIWTKKQILGIIESRSKIVQLESSFCRNMNKKKKKIWKKNSRKFVEYSILFPKISRKFRTGFFRFFLLF